MYDINSERQLGINLCHILSADTVVFNGTGDNRKPIIMAVGDFVEFTKCVFEYINESGETTTIDLAGENQIFNGLVTEGQNVVFAKGITSNGIRYKDGFFKEVTIASGQIWFYDK